MEANKTLKKKQKRKRIKTLVLVLPQHHRVWTSQNTASVLKYIIVTPSSVKCMVPTPISLEMNTINTGWCYIRDFNVSTPRKM